MDNPLSTPAGNLVVLDGAARATWSQGPALSTRFAGVWPSPDQRREVARHMRDRGAMLVVVEAAPSTVLVLRDEFDWAPEDPQSEVVEVTIPTLDWLPVRMRRAGERFRRQALLELLDVPVLQRPAVVVSGWVPRTRLRFALRSPGVRADMTPMAVAALADSVLIGESPVWRAIRSMPKAEVRGVNALLG